MHIPGTILFMAGCLAATVALGQSQSDLLSAIKNNDTSLIKSLLKKQGLIRAADADGDGVLMYAALYSTAGMMEVLLNAGADPNHRNKLGETPLMWAMPDVRKGKLLLEHGASPDLQSNAGNTALHIACVGNDQSRIVGTLLQHGATVNFINDKGGTALMRLAGYGDTASANLLLNKHAEINIKKNDSADALFIAVKCVNVPMVKWLLDHGADPQSLDQFNTTPFYYAVSTNNFPIISMLLEKTPDLNRPDIDGITPLMWAVYSEDDNPAIVKALIDKGADPNYKTKDGQSVMGWALKKGQTRTVELLKSYTSK